MEKTSLERAQEHLATGFRLAGDGLGGSHALAAQIAVVAQAEAAHRQADALERIALSLERIAGCVDEDGPTLIVRVSEDSTVATALERVAAVLEEVHA